MPKIYYAVGPGVRLVEVLAADDALRSEMTGDVHLVSLDGRSFYSVLKRPEAGDYDSLRELIEGDEGPRPMEYARGIVQRAFGEIEELEV